MRFFLLFLALCGCTGSDTEVFSQNEFYKRDVSISEGGKVYDGVAVLPERNSYRIKMKFAGNLDLFTFTDCHQEIVKEKAGSGGIFRDKNEITLDYRPTFAKGMYCPILIGGYEALKGRHSWGFVDFQTEGESLPATVYCNGDIVKSSGVTVCQTLSGLSQRIVFPVQTKTASMSPECDALEEKNGGLVYEISMPKGRCVYAFQEIGGEKRKHRLTTLGYGKILIRETRP